MVLATLIKCVCVFKFKFASSILQHLQPFTDCSAGQVDLLFSSLSLFLCPSHSLPFSLACVQVSAVVSFRKCTMLCWEVRYLPLGQTFFPPNFYQLLTGSSRCHKQTMFTWPFHSCCACMQNDTNCMQAVLKDSADI